LFNKPKKERFLSTTSLKLALKHVAIVFTEVYNLGTINDMRRGIMGALHAISTFLSLTEPTEFYEVPLMCFDDKE